MCANFFNLNPSMLINITFFFLVLTVVIVLLRSLASHLSSKAVLVEEHINLLPFHFSSTSDSKVGERNQEYSELRMQLCITVDAVWSCSVIFRVIKLLTYIVTRMSGNCRVKTVIFIFVSDFYD